MEPSDQPVTARRRLVTGAALGMGASALLLASRAEASVFPSGFVNVKDDYGAAGTGASSTDDTTAIQTAMDSGKAVYFPKGVYRITRPLTSAGKDLVLFGDGPDVSQIRLDAATDALVFTGVNGVDASGVDDIHQLVVSRLGFVAGTLCNAAIRASWTYQNPSQVLNSALIDEVTVTYAAAIAASRFALCIYLYNAQNSRITNCNLCQTNRAAANRESNVGIHLTSSTSEGAPDTQITGCQLVDPFKGVLIDSLVEGIRVENTSFLGADIGIHYGGRPAGKGWLDVSGCHFALIPERSASNTSIGVLAEDVYHVVVRGNHFLPNATVDPQGQAARTSFGVIIRRVTSSAPFLCDSIVAHNVFHSNYIPINGTVTYGVLVQGDPIGGAKGNAILIDGNRFSGRKWTNSAVFDANTMDVVYTNTNLGDSGETVADQTVPGTNVVSRKVFGSAGIRAASGSFNRAEAQVNYIVDGHTVNMQVTVIVYDNGSAGTSINVDMPFFPGTHCVLPGMRIEGGTGKACMGIWAQGTPTPMLRIVFTDGTYPGTSGAIIQMSGVAYL